MCVINTTTDNVFPTEVLGFVSNQYLTHFPFKYNILNTLA